MIETIYSNENETSSSMIRVQPVFKMPKNIRQVGKVSNSRIIYIEDYVMTFIKQLAMESETSYKIAVLIGQYVRVDNARNIFISGAIEVEGIDWSSEVMFTNDIWTNIYDNIKKYFVDFEIVGWFLGGSTNFLEEKDKILKTHLDNFAGQDKTLLTYDNLEKEESFLVFIDNRLVRQNGYYIYYEKNEEMQNYMIDHKQVQEKIEQFDDRVTKEIRQVIQNKKPAPADNKAVNWLMYAAGALLAVVVLIVSASMLNNVEQMKSMQNTLAELTENIGPKDEADPVGTKDNEAEDVLAETINENMTARNSDEGSLDVEVLPGNVFPLEEEESDQALTEDDSNDPQEEVVEATQVDEAVERESDEEEPAQEVIKKEVKYYTVEMGDTLAGISYKLYNSANYIKKIMKLNNIQDENVIIAGQKLIVP
ncbi:MAG: LysM peptidoglycan-binding domain-containing protein [Eubacteriales bacterium]|nr:LysM peptidoglycan-binding domain-containing protein [Eubacteriales bacterium]